MSDIDDIFESYLANHAEQATINFDLLLTQYPQQKESLQKKIKAYQKVMGLLGEQQPDQPDLINKVIGGCRLIRILGQGGMGVVYLAYQEKLGREVVVKILRPFALDNTALKERFVRESRTIGRLDHPHIVPVYDVGEEEGSSFIIMQHVIGVSLAKLIEGLAGKSRSDLSVNDVSKVMQDFLETNTPITLEGKSVTEFFCQLIIKVADAVQYAHEHGVIHRDIKPSNIIIEPNGNPVLLDFGLSHDEIEINMTLSGEFLGTPVYSAPETFEKKSITDLKKLDVYSLGVTLYETLTGALPYEGNSVYEIYNNIKNKEPVSAKKRWDGIARDLDTIISTASSRDQEYRYKTIQYFKDDIKSFLNYRPIAAKSPSRIRRLGYFYRRRKKLVLNLSVALLFSIIAGGCYYLWLVKIGQDIQNKTVQFIIKGEMKEAISYLEQKTQDATLLPIQNQINFGLSSLQIMTYNYDSAITNLEYSLAHKEDFLTRGLLAVALFAKGDKDKAQIETNRVLLVHPTNELALNVLELIKKSSGDKLGAIDAIKKRLPSSLLFPVRGNILNQPAFVQSPYQNLVLLFAELGFKNIALRYLSDGISKMPYHMGLYRLAEDLHLNIPQILFKPETASFYNEPLEIKIPPGWMHHVLQKIISPDILAMYMTASSHAEIMAPTIFLAQLNNSKSYLDDAYHIMDRTIVKYGGHTLTTDTKQINSGIEKFVISREFKVYDEKYELRALIIASGEQAYIISGIASSSTFERYWADIKSVMNSAKFTKSEAWQLYAPPYGVYTIQMPTQPFYWQELDTHYFVSDPSVYKDGLFQIIHSFLNKPLSKEQQEEEIKDLIQNLNKSGKIIFEEKKYGENGLSYEVKYLDSLNRIEHFKIFYIESNEFILDVIQDQSNYKEEQAINFFDSFVYNGQTVAVSRVGANQKVTQLEVTEYNYDTYLKDAMQGNPAAQNEIGKYLLSDSQNPEPVFEKMAFDWFSKAADQQYVKAINNLGLCYWKGTGTTKDSLEAKKWLLKAADLGFDIAQNNLAQLLLEFNNPESDRQAVEWIQKAAENGNLSAMYHLGSIYENGLYGLPQNYQKADYWYGKYFEGIK